MSGTPHHSVSTPPRFTLDSIAAFSQGRIAALGNDELIEIIRAVDYPYAGKERLEFFDRDTLQRVVHLVCRWCRTKLVEAESARETVAVSDPVHWSN